MIRISKVVQPIETHRGGWAWTKFVRENKRSVQAHFVMTGLVSNPDRITHVVWRRVDRLPKRLTHNWLKKRFPKYMADSVRTPAG